MQCDVIAIRVLFTGHRLCYVKAFVSKPLFFHTKKSYWPPYVLCRNKCSFSVHLPTPIFAPQKFILSSVFFMFTGESWNTYCVLLFHAFVCLLRFILKGNIETVEKKTTHINVWLISRYSKTYQANSRKYKSSKSTEIQKTMLWLLPSAHSSRSSSSIMGWEVADRVVSGGALIFVWYGMV